MWDSQEVWREWIPIVGVIALLILIIFSSRNRKLPKFDPGDTFDQVEDLPAVKIEWQHDVSVFDEPEKFGYQIYTDRHDRVVEAANFPRKPGVDERRNLLNRHIGLNAEATNRLAALLRERGIGSTTCTAILIDHSGSMRRKVGTRRGQKIEPEIIVSDHSGAAFAAGVAVSIALALEKCGASTELLGFTTGDWRGGQSRRDWIEAGKPKYPGRLNDLLHIIYKGADETSVAECSDRLEAFLRPALLKENIDGEAIAWARGRLLAQSVSDRLLIVISDGAAVDDSTIHENGRSYLHRHLYRVVVDITRRRDLRIFGIGIGYDISLYFPQSVSTGPNEQDFSNKIDAVADLISGRNAKSMAKNAKPDQ